MKKIYALIAAVFISIAGVPQPAEAQNWGRLIQAGAKGLQALTISDSQVQEYVRQYVQNLDAQSQVAPEGSKYKMRLDTIVSGITQVDGTPLNFKVYMTKDVNAFACADGSVRVYSGLMDLMDNNEVLGVIGHEIGHVAHKDTKKAFKEALTSSALRDVVGSTGGVVATLTDSQLGDIAEVLLSKGYSRKQETEADNYAYSYLKSRGINPLVMAKAFQKLESISGGGGSNAFMKAFSDHPDTNKRIKNIESQAKKDGFTYSMLDAGAKSGKKAKDGTSVSKPVNKSGSKSTVNGNSIKKTNKKSTKKR